MNKIFKTKRNRLGQSVVCSEMAKSQGKGKGVVGTIELKSFKVSLLTLALGLMGNTSYATTASLVGNATGDNSTAIGNNTYTTSVGGIAVGNGAVATGNNMNSTDFGKLLAENSALTSAVDKAQSDYNNATNALNANQQATASLSQQINDLQNKLNSIKPLIDQKNQLQTQKDNLMPTYNQAKDALDRLSTTDSQNIYLNFTNVMNGMDWSPLKTNSDPNVARNTVASQLQGKIEGAFPELVGNYQLSDYRYIVDAYINRQGTYAGSYNYITTNPNALNNAGVVDKLNNKIYFDTLLQKTPMNDTSFATLDGSKVNGNPVYHQMAGIAGYKIKGWLHDTRPLTNYAALSKYVSPSNNDIISQSVLNAKLLHEVANQTLKQEGVYNPILPPDDYIGYLAPDDRVNEASEINGVSFDDFYNNLSQTKYWENVNIFGLKTKTGTVLSPFDFDVSTKIVRSLQYSIDNQTASLSAIPADTRKYQRDFYQKLQDNYNNIDWNFDKSPINLSAYKQQYDNILAYNKKINDMLDNYDALIAEASKANKDQNVINQLTANFINQRKDILDNAFNKSNYLMAIDLNYDQDTINKVYYADALPKVQAIIQRTNEDLRLYDANNTIVKTITTNAQQVQQNYDTIKKQMDALDKQINAISIPADANSTSDLIKAKQDEKDKLVAAKNALQTDLNNKQKALDEAKQALSANGLTNLGLRNQAYGDHAFVSGTDSIAMGTNAVVLGNNSVAIGANNIVTGNNSSVLGQNNIVNSNNAVAIGNNISIPTGYDNSVVLGNDSMPSDTHPTNSVTIKGNTYTFSGSNPVGTVSVGAASKERQITNVAAGRISASSTDAINGSQLYATNQAIENLTVATGNTVQYDDNTKGSITLGGTGGTTVTNVKNGDVSANSMDAVNGSQLNATNNLINDVNTTLTKRIKYIGVKTTDANGSPLPDLANVNGEGATGDYSVAIGANSSASGKSAIAIGWNTQANADFSIAMGVDSVADRDGAFAAGISNAASGNGAVAMGQGSKATGTGAVAIGNSTTASGDSAAAMGNNSNAFGRASTAMGFQSQAVGDNSLAANGGVTGIGAEGSLAVGINAQASGRGAVALGSEATSGSAVGGAVAFFAFSDDFSDDSLDQPELSVVDKAPIAEGDYSLATGQATVASGTYSTAMGYQSQARGDNSTAIGWHNLALGVGSTAMGNGTTARGDFSTALGQESIATGNNSLAANGGKAKSDNSLAIGVGAIAGSSDNAPDRAIAIGENAQALADNTIAIGTRSHVTGANSGAFGNPNTVNSTGSYAFGNNNTINQDNNNTFVLGNDVTTTQSNSVVLGNASSDKAATGVASANIRGTTYTFAGAKPVGVVSVGSQNNERQIQNVAAGQISATSTDAINGSQLYAVADAVNNLDAIAVKYDSPTKDTITLSGSNGTTIRNVAAGVNGTDAVNKDQLTTGLASKADATYVDTKNTQQDANILAAKTELVQGNNTTITKSTGKNGQDIYRVSSEKSTTSTGSSAVIVTAKDMGNNTTDYQVDLSASTKAALADIVNKADKTELDKTNQTVANNKAIADSQNTDTNARITNEVTRLDTVNTTQNNNISANTQSITDTNTRLIGEVARIDGVNTTQDALIAQNKAIADNQNVATNTRIDATNSQVATNAANIAKGINIGGTTGSNNYQLGDTINIKGDSNITSTTVSGGVQLALSPDLTANSMTTGNTKTDSNGVTVTGGSNGTVALTSAGLNNGNNKVINIANGEVSATSTDAVNGSQLYGYTQALIATSQNAVMYSDATKDKVILSGANGTTITNVANGAVNTTSTDAINGSQLYQTNAQVAQNKAIADSQNADTNARIDATNAQVADNTANIAKGINLGGTTGSNNYQMGDTINIKGDSNVTSTTVNGGVQLALNPNLVVDSITTGDTKTDTNGIAITGGANGTVALSKTGLDNGNNKAINIADGDMTATSTDAVNGSQLYGVDQASKERDNQLQSNIDIISAGIVKGLNIGGTTGTNNYQLGDAVNIKGDSNITSTTVQGGVQLGLNPDLVVDSVTTGNTKTDTNGVVVAGGANGTVALSNQGLDNGNNKVVNVADGAVTATSKDAVNGSQLHATNQTVDKNNTDSIARDNQLQNNINTNKDIADAKDAATNTRIDITNQNVATNAANIAKGLNIGGSVGSNNYQLGDAVNIKGDNNITSTTVQGGIQLALNPDLTVNSVTTGNTKTSDTGVVITGGANGTVALSNTGLDNGNNKVVNVANGEISATSKDAVNGSQLHETNQVIAQNKADADAKNVATNARIDETDTIVNQNNINSIARDNQLQNNINTNKDIADAKDAATNTRVDAVNNTIKKGINFGGTTGSNNYQLGNTISVKGDSNITSKTIDGGVQLGLNPDITVNSVTTGNAKTDTNGLTIVGGKNGKVSLTNTGLDNGNNKITNIANGDISANSKDAINGSQLYQTNVVVGDLAKEAARLDNVKADKAAVDNANAIQDQAINQLGYKIDDMDKSLSAGIAATAALTQAPYVSGKWTYAVGGATYRGQSAVGAELRRTADNGRWSITGGVASGTEHGDTLLRIGVTGVIN